MAVKKSDYLLPLLLLTLNCCFAFFDVKSSGQAGLKDDLQRGTVHIFILLLLLVHLVYFIFKRRRMGGDFGISFVMMLIIFWMCLVDVCRQTSVVSAITMMMLSVWWYLTYIITYSWAKNNEGSVDILIKIFIILFGVYVLVNLYARLQIRTNFDRDVAVTGYAYYCLIFLPFILLLRQNRYRFILLAILIVMVLTSFKRGTMITLPIMLLFYGYASGKLNHDIKSFTSKAIILGAIICFTIGVLNESSGGFLEERFSKESLSDGSGRVEMADMAWQNIESRNMIDLFVGFGHGTSIRLIGTGVHNEWLEFLFSFGVIGVSLFFILGICICRQCRYYYKKKSKFAPQSCMLIPYFYMVTIFSGFYGVYVTYYFFAFLGLVKFLNERDIKLLSIK